MAPSPRSVFECQRYRSPQQLRHSGLQITPLPGSKPWLAGSPHSPSHRFGYLGSSPKRRLGCAFQRRAERMMFGAGWELRHMSISELMHRPERARRLEVFTGAGRRRTWPDDEKAAIVAESYAPGRTVCGVARRHGLTPAQLFTWRRLARRSRWPKAPVLFVPAVVEPSPGPPPPPAPQPQRARQPGPVMGIEVEMDGIVVRIGSGASPQAIAAVIRALKVGPLLGPRAACAS